MKKLLLLKIGGGVITDKKVRYGLKEEVLKRLVKEIAEGYKQLKETDLIIGNGGGSFPHFSAHKYGTADGFIDGQGRIGVGWVHYDAVTLNQIVMEELLKLNVPVFSFSPSSIISLENGRTKTIFLDSVKDAMKKGLIPLMYGDAMIDEDKGSGIFSTERIFDEIAKVMLSSYEQIRVIHVSSEEGVLAGGKVLTEITDKNIEQIEGELAGSGGIDVTGGMLHKVRECLAVAKMGVESMIISGLAEGRVKQVMAELPVVGTRIC